MTDPTLEDRVKTVLSEVFGIEPDEIGPDTSTDTVERWDSLQHLSVVLALEEEFGIQFADEETIAVVNFPLILAIVGDRLGTTPA
jgi:acyl carrier protein